LYRHGYISRPTRLAGAIAFVAVVLAGPALATAETGQSPGCKRFCMSVEPRAAPEGSVFRFEGRGWRPNRQVTATFGAYCRPSEACIAIAYVAQLKTNDRGRFVFLLRAGRERQGDDRRRIRSGGAPTFSQRRPGGRSVSRAPRYQVILPD
jgi:hypothetical protein